MRFRAALPAIGGAVLVGVLAALVFLIRAGGDPSDAATWPIQWELRSSDNGVLFQFFQDVAAGRPLDWSFSPQVYVVPELPVSGLAFLVAGGDVYLYYLVIAALNAAGMFLTVLALVRVLFPAERSGVPRALLASVPLLLFPLIGTSWILSFHLAATYYVGEYAALLLAPVLVLARSNPARIAVGVFLALTIASNPLTLVFAGAGGLAALVAGMVRTGPRSARRPGAWVLGTLVVAALARAALTPLQGTSPLAYVDLDRFRGRLAGLGQYYAYQLLDPSTRAVLITGAILSVVLAGLAIAAFVVILRRRGRTDARLVAVVYLGAMPLGGIAGTFALLITHYYYFWPVLILPYVLVLLAVPRVALPPGLVLGAGGLVVVALATGALTNLPAAGGYFGYRNAETRCLDEAAPGRVGYATFSDARRVGLPSATGIRLIPITSDLSPNHWLANRAISRTEAGSFFYVNGHGDEAALDTRLLAQRFGMPDEVAACGDGQEVWLYDDPGKLDAIADFYGAPRP